MTTKLINNSHKYCDKNKIYINYLNQKNYTFLDFIKVGFGLSIRNRYDDWFFGNNNISYWFNNPYGKINLDIIKYCEWYRYKECRIYFDSIDDLIIKIKNLTPEIIQLKKNWCKIYYGKRK